MNRRRCSLSMLWAAKAKRASNCPDSRLAWYAVSARQAGMVSLDLESSEACYVFQASSQVVFRARDKAHKVVYDVWESGLEGGGGLARNPC